MDKLERRIAHQQLNNSLWKIWTNKKRENGLDSVSSIRWILFQFFYPTSECCVCFFFHSKLKLVFIAIHWNAKEYHNTHPMTESSVLGVDIIYLNTNETISIEWTSVPYRNGDSINFIPFRLRYGFKQNRHKRNRINGMKIKKSQIKTTTTDKRIQVKSTYRIIDVEKQNLNIFTLN